MNPHELDTTEFNHCFGIPAPFSGFLAIGFSCMTVLKTAFVPVWAVLSILTLHTLHIDLSDGRFWYETEEFGAEWYEIDDGKSCNHIKHVILALNMAVLETWENGRSIRHDIGVYQTTKNLLNRLGGLMDLRVHLCYREAFPWYIY
jgi:hypothetical protein